MPLIRPFKGLRPTSEKAGEVAAPPYDVVSHIEAVALAKDSPNNFLHISRPEIDLPEGTDPYSREVYDRGRLNLRRLINDGTLKQDDQECFYVYRLIDSGVTQTGLVVAASIEAYDANAIKKHEFTRPEKESDRVRQIDALSAQTGPVLLTYSSVSEIDRVLTAAATRDPDIDVITRDNVRHQIWQISDRQQIDFLVELFEGVPSLYIADGHHRSAAASRVRKIRRSELPSDGGLSYANDYFLAVVFPTEQMRILSYNRVVSDLNGLKELEFLQRLRGDFLVEASSVPVVPDKKGTIGLYMRGGWSKLVLKPNVFFDHPIEKLDVSILSDRILGPVLGIHDLRKDKRIDFVGGNRGTEELVSRVESGEMACAFSLFPTQIQDLMTIADEGEVMPPKSTWFEPKLADGLVSHILE